MTADLIERLERLAKVYAARSGHPVGPAWSAEQVLQDRANAADLNEAVALLRALSKEGEPNG